MYIVSYCRVMLLTHRVQDSRSAVISDSCRDYHHVTW